MFFWLGLLALFVTVALLARMAADRVVPWWNARLEIYAHSLVLEYDAMFRDLTAERAQRLIRNTTIGGLLCGALLGWNLAARLIAMALLGSLGFVGPRAFATFLRQRRLAAIDNQLVDALTLMSNGLRAGLSLQQAIKLVVHEMPAPIADEFGRILKEIDLGRLTDEALRRFRERVPLEDVKLATDSILTLRETGGNLSETFDVIARTVAERKKVQGKVKTMTAQGMTQGILLCLMPIGMLLLFSVLSTDLIKPFFTTPLGMLMLLVVFSLDALGLFLMFRLVKVDV